MTALRTPLFACVLAALAAALAAGCDAPPERDEARRLLARWEDGRQMDPDSLAVLLRDDDVHIRLAALRTAGRIGRDGVLPELIAALDDPIDAVRAEAALALGFLGDDRAREVLEANADHGHQRVRRAVLFALARVENDGEALWEPALHGEPADAALAWNALRDQSARLDSTRLATALRAGLVRNETDVLWRVLRCAERSGSHELIPEIAAFTTHDEAQVRVHACRALGALAADLDENAPADEALDAVLAAYDHIDRMGSRSASRVRIAALRALGALAGPRLFDADRDPMPVVARLTEGARDENPHVARTALEAMAAVVDDRPPPLHAVERESLLPAWRIRLLQAARKGLAPSVDLDDGSVPDGAPEPVVRAAAVRAVCALRGPGLMLSGDDPSWTVINDETTPQVQEEARAGVLTHVLPYPLVYGWLADLDADEPERLLLAITGALPAAKTRLEREADRPGFDEDLLGLPLDAEDFDRRMAETLRALLVDAPWTVRAQCAGLLGSLPSDEILTALLASWRDARGWTGDDVRLGVLEALAAIFPADETEWSPSQDLGTEIARLLEEGFDAADVRQRRRARDVAEASGLLPHERIPSLESLEATVPAVTRHPDQGPTALPFDAPEVVCRTDRGEFTIELDGRRAPNTCATFLALIREGYYDGLLFHRVVPDFVIQGGCPDGTGWGGPGYSIRSEWSDAPYERGTVGIAHSGKDTGGSQFFVGLSPQPHLNGRYTVFGRVVKGMDVAESVQPDDAFRLEIVGE